MTSWQRWLRFNLVGLVGVPVQLAALAGLRHVFPDKLLTDTAIAVELALFHNFVWHKRFTWLDQTPCQSSVEGFFRFQATNGVISLIGTPLLTALSVKTLHLPLLVANTTAVACCATVNFFTARRWVFRTSATPSAYAGVLEWRHSRISRNAP